MLRRKCFTIARHVAEVKSYDVACVLVSLLDVLYCIAFSWCWRMRSTIPNEESAGGAKLHFLSCARGEKNGFSVLQ